MAFTPKALVDFDGVIHRYSKGWSDGTAYDPPMPGALGGLKELERRGFEVVVFSTRAADQIEAWLTFNGFPAYRVTNVKEPAQFMLDDRAVHFTEWGNALAEIADRYPVGARP